MAIRSQRGALAEVPSWRLTGDWFDVCRCRVPWGCTFAQAPDEGQCDGILAWHVREGSYGDVTLDGLNVVAVGSFEGNIWTGGQPAMGFFIDERADAVRTASRHVFFAGQAGSWPAVFAELIKDVRGIELAPIDFEIADDLAHSRVEVPGEGQGQRRGSHRADRSKGAPVPVHNAPARRSAPARSPHGPPPRRTRWRHSASSGAGRPLKQALPVRLVRTGQALTCRVGRPPSARACGSSAPALSSRSERLAAADRDER
jgi:hypothetical protein